MNLKRMLDRQELNLETMEYIESGRMDVVHGGGGKGAAPAPQPIIAPTPPIQEAGIVADNTSKDTTKQGKATLKVPMTDKSLFGTPVATATTSASDAGLKV